MTKIRIYYRKKSNEGLLLKCTKWLESEWKTKDYVMLIKRDYAVFEFKNDQDAMAFKLHFGKSAVSSPIE